MRAGDVLVRRLRDATRFTIEEEALLLAAASDRTRHAPARSDLVREGDRPASAYILLAGWACRYKMLEDGRRQIVAILLPGDLCDFNAGVLSCMDHSIGTISAVHYAELSFDRLNALAAGSANIQRALWLQMLGMASMQREWTTNVGQRSAFERVGHLFCETLHRMRAVGLSDGRRCDMPLTQVELAEATGLTAVHVNRTLQEMRAQQLIILKERTLEVRDPDALEQAVLFTPDYLHLQSGQPTLRNGAPRPPTGKWP